MKVGTVKWFNDTKGYGFLVGPDSKDVFVHYSSIEGNGFKSLVEGEQVEFEDEKGPRGTQATRVIRSGDAADSNRSNRLDR